MQFREKVMNKMFIPDDTDSLPRVTTPVGWISLLTVFVLLSALLVWALWGRVSLTINGNGLLMTGGGISRISAPISGVLQFWNVKEGDRVKYGDIMAEIYSLDTDMQITKIKTEMENSAQDAQRYQQLKNELDAMVNRLNVAATITAPLDGTIHNISKNIYEYVKEGESIANIAAGSSQQNLNALVYVSGAVAKRITPGMNVRMELGNVRADKYGYLLGKVDRISQYPVNIQQIVDNVGNEALTNWLVNMQQPQPVFEVAVELIPDAQSHSGYVWSTVDGGPNKLSGGTPLTAFCVTDQRRPIELVFDWLNVLLN
ncbi:MAG: HlyD family efflux transporter periplasmic adaptor subunit [Bacillota bacterium]